jgi:hypothetical protein
VAGKEIAVKKYVVRLSAEERAQLDELMSKGKRSAQLLTKARILLNIGSTPCGLAGGAAVYANMFGREWREPAALFLPFLDAVFRQPVPLSRYLAGRVPGADSHFAVRIHC